MLPRHIGIQYELEVKGVSERPQATTFAPWATCPPHEQVLNLGLRGSGGAARQGLSASAIGRLKDGWLDEHTAWQRRDLSAKRYVYLWANGIHLQARLEDERQCILVLIGATPEGRKELVGFIDGARESAQDWRDLLLDLKRRGLDVPPRLAIADGVLGFWKAADEAAAEGHALREIWMAETKVATELTFDALHRELRAEIRESGRLPEQGSRHAARFLRLPGRALENTCERLMRRISDFFSDRDDDCGDRCQSILLFGRPAGHSSVPAIDLAAGARRGVKSWSHLPPTARLGFDRPEHGSTLPWNGTALLVWLEFAISGDYGCRARATSWRSVTRPPQASPDCLFCPAELRRPRAGFWPPRFPLRHESFVALLRLGGNQHLAVAQHLDVVGIGWSTPAALLLRMSGLKLHRARLVDDQRWACAQIILALRQQMPAKHSELASHGYRGDLMATPGVDSHERSTHWTGRLCRCPGRLDQHGARVTAADLADATVMGRS